ncbi:MAG: hypothetical protein N2258_07575 [Brevinematales bacterium]|nr:hypothetical protein [Brevinematales bacterium]
MENNKLKKILTFIPVILIFLFVITLLIFFFMKSNRYNVSEYEKNLSQFYENLSLNNTNKIIELTSSDFINNETNLPLKKNNYKLFSYKFEIVTNEIQTNKVENVKLIYSILINEGKTNLSILKEVYFSPDSKKIIQIKDLYIGKDITKKP